MVKDNILSTRVRKIGIAGLGFLVFGILFRTIAFPSLLESQIKKIIALKKGSLIRETWSNFPFELHVYLFNVTNPDEIDTGGKPIVKEVGPFVYDVWQEKINQMDYEEDDTLSYSLKNTYYFNSEKSNGYLDDNEFTFAHLICLSMPNGMLKSNPSRVTIGDKAIESIINHPKSVFVKAKAKTFLFDGFRAQCKGKDEFFAMAVCNDMEQFWRKYRMVKGDGYFCSSIYGNLNGTDVYNGKVRIRRGIRNIMEVGDVVEYNEMKNMSVWKNDECDALIGTDGTMFHPFLDKKRLLYVSKTFYCRGLTYQYDSVVEFAGLKLLRYTTSLGSNTESNPKEKCFCIKPDECLKDGVYELYKCFTLARIGSNPHFYLADSYYVNAVEGLDPIKEKHMSILDIDPLTGLSVRAQFRIQYSMELRKIKKYRLMKNFPEALLPLTWSDEIMILPDFVIKQIRSTHKMVTTSKMFSYFMILVGLIMCGYTVFSECKLIKEKRTVIKSVRIEIRDSEFKNSTTNKNLFQMERPISVPLNSG